MKWLHWFVPVLVFVAGYGGGYATSHLLRGAEARNLQAKVTLQEHGPGVVEPADEDHRALTQIVQRERRRAPDIEALALPPMTLRGRTAPIDIYCVPLETRLHLHPEINGR